MQLDVKTQLRGKAYGPHHAQRIVAEGCCRFLRGAYATVVQVLHPVERVDELSVPFLVQRNGQSVDGEIAAQLIVL